MLARDIMSHPVVSVRPWTPIAECAAILVDRGFSAAPVLDDDDRLVGIVSEADLLRWPLPADTRRQPLRPADEHQRPPVQVAEVMTATVESLTPGADVADAARMMVAERIRCLPIVDGSQVVGVITRRDLLRWSVSH